MSGDINMRNNKIMTIYFPVNPNYLTSKSYVERLSGSGIKQTKHNVWYIPTLFNATDNRVGFEVSASSYYPENYPHYSFSDRREWTTNGKVEKFGLKLNVPLQSLFGNLNSSIGRIYNWWLEGSNDDINWTMLYITLNTYNKTQYFTIPSANTVNKYLYFCVNVFAAEHLFPGLTAF